jgi:hypothetical protein
VRDVERFQAGGLERGLAVLGERDDFGADLDEEPGDHRRDGVMVDGAPADKPEVAVVVDHAEHRPYVLQREHQRVQRVAATVMLCVLRQHEGAEPGLVGRVAREAAQSIMPPSSP